MVQQYALQTNLSAGEIDPKMAGRADTAAYQNGAKALHNVALLNTGGGTRRPGFAHLAALGASARVIPFDYDETKRYVIALGNGTLYVYGIDGTLKYGVATSITLAQCFELTYTQLGDTLILAHQSFLMGVLRRYADASWTLTDFAFETSPDGLEVHQPYEKLADANVTLTPSGIQGNITITASAALFEASHVGTRVRIYGVECVIYQFNSSTSVAATVQGTIVGKYGVNPFQAVQGSTTIRVTHVAHGIANGSTIIISNANDIQTVAFSGTVAAYNTALAAGFNGSRTITVIDPDTYSFTGSAFSAGTGAYQTVDGGGPNVQYNPSGIATRNWDIAVFNPVYGYPRAVAFHEQRLWLGGSPIKPSGMWSSRINRFFNFSVGQGLDNESIQAAIGSDQGSSIRHIVSNRHLQIFTGTSEFYCPQTQSQQTLTPANFSVRRQTPYGTGNVRPVPFDGATLFAQANGKTIREFLYADSDASYNSNNISFLSPHLINAPVDMAALPGTTERGEQYAVLVMSDGTLSVFHSARSEKLAGWTPWSTATGHAFVSVCVVGNVLYAITNRAGAYAIEKMQADDSLTLDGAASLAAAATTSWTLPARYAGKAVWVIVGNYSLGEIEADGSAHIDLIDPVTEITVGYNFETRIETLPPAIQTPQGSKLGARTRIAEVLVWIDSTSSMSLEGKRLILRHVDDAIETSPAPVTRVERFFLSGYSRQPTVVITQAEPLALRVLALKTKVVC